jgi:hypothetical protein
MLSNVQYDRVSKAYQVLDPETGAIESFPSGYRGRRDANRKAIHFQNARLHRIVTDLVRKWPQGESRAWRAAELVIREAVHDPADNQALATVTGHSEYGDYLVADRKGLIVCDCIDYMDGNAPYFGSNGQRLCKHILAVQFRRRLEQRSCGSCGQKVDAELMECPFCAGPVTPY